MVPLQHVRRGGPAWAAGLRAGDRLLACSGREPQDWLDIIRLCTGPSTELVYRRGPLERRVLLRRRPGADWGMTPAGMEPDRCRRRCVFCFVAQNPPGVRPSLRVRDDDVRHSFLHGTYVTLDDAMVREAVRRSLSPLHVSVHATDPEVRGRLLGSAGPAPVLGHLDELGREGIRLSAQVVLVPGWNDGVVLRRTLLDLLELPRVTEVGVVPVGLTEHRQGLTELRRPTAPEAAAALETVRVTAEAARGRRGVPWVYPADELLSIAGAGIPPAEAYEGCTMEADGIGLLSALSVYGHLTCRRSGALCTGGIAAPHLRRLLRGSGVRVLTVRNTFFGPEVGVAGLMSGLDVVRTVRDLGDGERVLLPSVMLDPEGRTLDGLTVLDMERLAGCGIDVLSGPAELFEECG